ncbi:hypothetical protein HYV43_01040 [Candidatus Micrarchaeota archaeon]|nr:hypothetical protein [Candidatus Micrarchaeota archaeon]
MEERRVAAGAQVVIDHLKKGGIVRVVNWPKANDRVRSGLKNRVATKYTSTAWTGHFLPVRDDEVKGKDLKELIGVALVHEPESDKDMKYSGIIGTLALHPDWRDRRK